MRLSTVVATFAGAVLAAIVGWFGGGLVHDALEPAYSTAVGVVDARAGIPVATASPTPTPSVEIATTATPSETTKPEDTPGSILCEGAPPDDKCDCDLQNGDWVWVCEIEASPEGSPTAAPTVGP